MIWINRARERLTNKVLDVQMTDLWSWQNHTSSGPEQKPSSTEFSKLEPSSEEPSTVPATTESSELGLADDKHGRPVHSHVQLYMYIVSTYLLSGAPVTSFPLPPSVRLFFSLFMSLYLNLSITLSFTFPFSQLQ